MISNDWIDEDTLTLLTSADIYYLLLLSSLFFVFIIFRVFIELGFEFFVNN